MIPDTKKRDPHDVRKMFARVSRVYDAANHTMCFGLDIIWRAKLVGTLLKRSAPDCKSRFIDIACGSGDVALKIADESSTAQIVCADFCAEMLEVAKKKAEKSGVNSRMEFLEADCATLPFADATFDGATISFGFRNFKDRPACLREIARILKPSAPLAMLEVARAKGIFAHMQKFFMTLAVPLLARLCGGEIDDYKYLAKSTLEYPPNNEVAKMFTDAGFENVKIAPLGFGLVAITSATKSK